MLIKHGSTRFKIPIIYEMGLGNLATSEPWMMELIHDLYKNHEGTFVDIGANIGQTLLKLKSVCPTVEYIGFEPNPACVYYLRELIKVNHLQHSIVIPAGLYHTSTLLELFYYSLSEVNSGASVVEDYRSTNKIYDRQFVPVFNFDSLSSCLKLTDIAILKIDVEGAEMEVI